MAASDDKIRALYPVSERQADTLRTPGGHRLSELTLAHLLTGDITPRDIAISADALRAQATVARATGRGCLAENFERGAELTEVPQEEIFEAYELLRPGRAKDKDALLTLARRYREHYGAANIAKLIEDAAEVYERRGLFRKRF